jgi:hypothetical protein
MQVTFDLPDWVRKDDKPMTGRHYDVGIVELAGRFYRLRLGDPMETSHLSERQLVALHGDSSQVRYQDLPIERMASATSEETGDTFQ